MATTTSIDKTARTAREMAEAQRDAYEALAENLAAAQRRGIGLAEGGLEFARLQENNAKAAQEWVASGLRLLQLQQRNAEFVGDWADDAVEVAREQAEQNLRTVEAFARGIGRQQESLRALTRQWAGAYADFFSPYAYARRGVRVAQQATRQGLEVTEQAARQGLRATEQGLKVAEEVVERTEEAAREAELRTVVFGALKTSDYDALTVDEVSRRIDGLSVEQLRKVREFEKRNKDRETLIGQIDRKIRANS